MKNNLLIIFCLIIAFFPKIIFGAYFSLETNKDFYYQGDTFLVTLYLESTVDEPINALEVYLAYPKEKLKLKNVNLSNSIILSINKPVIDENKGIITFSGIIPGGFTGTVRGDPGKSNLVASFVFEALQSGIAEIQILPQTTAYLNDSLATPAKVLVKNLRVEIKKEGIEPLLVENEWENIIKNDKNPPNIDLVKIVYFEGEYYLVIQATDKESGIKNYYARPVGISTAMLRILNPRYANWEKIEIPHKLSFLFCQFRTVVKVEDNAGNVSLASVFLPLPFLRLSALRCSIIIVLIILGIIFLQKWLFLHFRKK